MDIYKGFININIVKWDYIWILNIFMRDRHIFYVFNSELMADGSHQKNIITHRSRLYDELCKNTKNFSSQSNKLIVQKHEMYIFTTSQSNNYNQWRHGHNRLSGIGQIWNLIQNLHQKHFIWMYEIYSCKNLRIAQSC